VQLQRCLPWLNSRAPESSESRRYAAVLMLRRLAEAQPAVFNVHVKQFIDSIWGALRDPKVTPASSRERKALPACLPACRPSWVPASAPPGMPAAI
jgi:FKBP12-rapamycin complex-associated protein